jgi:uncharacterized protein YbbC (DUF1343 family)/CubicO group peptidase (beta-lactamase class C family)
MRTKKYCAGCALLLAFTCFASAATPARRAPKAASGVGSRAPSRAILDPRFVPVAAVVQQAIAEHKIPGAVLLVGHNGKVVYRQAFGHRSVEPTVEPMTINTIFDMASLTKPLATAMSMMRLLELGQVRLNDTLAHYIPECAANGKQDITLRQLLTHYSGFRPDIDLKPDWTGYDEAIRLSCAEKLQAPPGSAFIYSDTNYILLGEVVRRVSGMTLDKYATAHIFSPLGMQRTRFLPPPEWRPLIAPTAHEIDDTSGPMLRGVVHDPRARRMGGVAGHAGLFSTADDVAKLAQALLDRKPLAPLVIEKMTTPQTPPNATALRGLGWDIDTPFSSNRGDLLPVGSFGHTGFTGTSLWIDRTTSSYIVLLANGVHPRGPGGTVVELRTKVATAVAVALKLAPSASEKLRIAEITGYNELLPGLRRVTARNGQVLNGIDVLEAENFAPLHPDIAKPRRIGIVTNQSGLTLDGRRTIDVLANVSGLKLAAIFSPEHGVTGSVDTSNVGNTVDAATGVAVYSVYGDTDAKKRPSLDVLRQLDAVIYDIQDAGVRFYTYETTLGYFVEAAGKSGTELVVLDRPNPINGVQVQGPVSDGGSRAPGGSCEASAGCPFIDYFPEPVRQGMTVGELAQMFNAERQLGARLTVVPMRNWLRGDWFDSTGQVLIAPSPNLRNLTEMILYPGVCIVEGTNVSVGRGTYTPFEIVGAPWIKPRELAAYLNARNLAGVRFVPTTFTPAKDSKLGGQLLGGINIVLIDRNVLDGPQMGVEIASALHTLYPREFQMERMVQLLGNRAAYDAVAAGQDPRRIAEDWRDDVERFMKMREKYLIYGHREQRP